MKKIMATFITLILLICSLSGLGSYSGCSPSFTVDNGDYVYEEGHFTLEIKLDKTEVSIDDEITVTAVFKNLSGRDLDISIRMSKSDLLEYEEQMKQIIYFKIVEDEKDEHFFRGFSEPTKHILKKDLTLTIDQKISIESRLYEIGDYYVFAYNLCFNLKREINNKTDMWVQMKSNIVKITII